MRPAYVFGFTSPGELRVQLSCYVILPARPYTHCSASLPCWVCRSGRARQPPTLL